MVVADDGRLSAHLGVCAAVAAQARILQAHKPPRVDAATAAALRTRLEAAPVAA